MKSKIDKENIEYKKDYANYEEVVKINEAIRPVIDGLKVRWVDVYLALATCCIEVGHDMGMSKPHFLSQLSSLWEKYESYQDD